MAIIMRDMLCPFCRRAYGDDAVRVLRWLTNNQADPLFGLSEQVLHARCADESGVLLAYPRADPRRGSCGGCGELISAHRDPTARFDLGRVAWRPDSPLYEFNHLLFNDEHLAQWPRWAEFNKLLDEAIQRGEWRGGRPVVGPPARWSDAPVQGRPSYGEEWGPEGPDDDPDDESREPH